VRQSFVYARDFIGDEDLDAQARQWLCGTANVRTHRTTKERPLERFARDEQAMLLSLAPRPYRSILLPSVEPRQKPVVVALPRVEVERRPLRAYAAIAAGAR
jgi:hypothetical protein